METQSISKAQHIDIVNIISSHPVFTHFNKDEIECFSSFATVQLFEPNEIIVSAGDLVDSIYFILNGVTEVRKPVHTESGDELQPIGTLNTGESIGLSETGFYSETGMRKATIVAITPVIVAKISLQDFHDFLMKHPHGHQEINEISDVMLRMQFIKQAVPFAEITNEKIRELTTQIKETKLNKGEILFHQGDIGTECYLIRSGKIEIFIQDQTGAEHNLATLSTPSIFGESALLIETPRNASARVLEDAILFVISKELFNELLKSEKTTAQAIMDLHGIRSRPIQVLGIEQFHSLAEDGTKVVTLRNVKLGHYYRLSETAWFIWERLDGKHSVYDITMDFYNEFNIFNSALIYNFIVDLNHAGFVKLDIKKHDIPETELIPFWMRAVIKIRKFMEFRYAFSSIDDFLTKTYNRYLWICFTIPAQIFMALITIIGFFIFLYYTNSIVDSIAVAKHKWLLLVASIIGIMCTIVFHELAHAYTTKYFNRRVYCFGIGWLWLSPMAFCDTSDMWLSSSKSRIIVDLAGLYLNIFLGAVASFILLLNINPSLNIILWCFTLLNYMLVFANLNPIIQLDGYYTLMDLLNRPNLRESAMLWLAEYFSKDKKPISFKDNFPEIVYWIVCIIYILLEAIIPYLVSIYLLRGLFNVQNPLYSILIALLIILTTLLSIWAEFIRKRRLLQHSN